MKRNALTRAKNRRQAIKVRSWATALSEFVTLFLLLNLLKIQVFCLNFWIFRFAQYDNLISFEFLWIATPAFTRLAMTKPKHLSQKIQIQNHP